MTILEIVLQQRRAATCARVQSIRLLWGDFGAAAGGWRLGGEVAPAR
jgi:hypothetical protein